MERTATITGLACIGLLTIAIAVWLFSAAFKQPVAPVYYPPNPYYVPQYPDGYKPTPNDRYIPNPYYVPPRPGEQGALGSKGAKETK